VADLGASTRWYRDTLGLRVVMQRPRTDETRAAMTLLQGGGLTVELVQQDESKPLRSALPDGRGALYLHGIFKFGFTIDDFDATIAELRRRGIPIAIGPFPKRADQPANAIIRDNAGNYLQLFGK
jgi:catechol 2,3-dioxygenase-like lactoylglutathione lyase family enzyme